MSKPKVTGDDVVVAARIVQGAAPAKVLAHYLGTFDSRGVATAARKPVADGRLKIRYKGGIAYYRFVRMSVKPRKPQP